MNRWTPPHPSIATRAKSKGGGKSTHFTQAPSLVIPREKTPNPTPDAWRSSAPLGFSFLIYAGRSKAFQLPPKNVPRPPHLLVVAHPHPGGEAGSGEGAHGQSPQAPTPRWDSMQQVNMTGNLLESPTVRVFPGLTWRSRSSLLTSPGIYFWPWRLDVVQWAGAPFNLVSESGWRLDDLVIMSMEPFMETGPEKVSNEN